MSVKTERIKSAEFYSAIMWHFYSYFYIGTDIIKNVHAKVPGNCLTIPLAITSAIINACNSIESYSAMSFA